MWRTSERWAITEACLQLTAWQEAGLPLLTRVNLSARQVNQPDLVDRLVEIAADSQISPSALCLETTETAMMADLGAAPGPAVRSPSVPAKRQPPTSPTAERTEQVAGVVRAPSQALVPVPRADEEPEPLRNPRRSDIDEWGRSERVRDIIRTLYEPIYRNWFRVEWEGMEHIPAEGGALLVANHAGALPSDAPAIMHGIETELGRPVYGLAEYIFRSMPIIGTWWARAGGVAANPQNAYRLLREQQQLVLVFPEGTKGPSKHYTERYKLRRFGRGGFIEIAMRAGVPVVPIAVVGAEESMPILFNLPPVAKALRLPYAPITANMLLGPLGAMTYFPAKFRIRVLEPIHFDVPPDQPRYSRSRVMDLAEEVRELIQAALYDMLRTRRSVWFG